MNGVDKLIEQARANGGTIEYRIAPGSGVTLNTERAIEKRGHTVTAISGKWQTREGLLRRLTLKAE